MDFEPLSEAGLTDGEIKVYVALLELGLSTSGPIVEQSRVAKSIVYPLLDKLMKKGLVSVIVKKKTKYFQASDPQKLLEYVDERKDALEENRTAIELLLPKLMMKQALVTKSETRMYFGFKGMTTAHEHIYEKLKKGQEYVYLGIPVYQPKTHHLYWQKDHTRKQAYGISCRLLFNAKTDEEVVNQRNSYSDTQARRMREGIVTPAMIGIFADTVIICVQSPEVVTIEIINQQIANSFKAYFEHFWKLSGE